jgi:salicylate hydroxylase
VPPSAPDVPIAVVGAGIGGLTLGLALRRLGVAVQLFEQTPALTEVGAAVALAANGARILSGLGLGERIAEVAVEPAALVHRHGIHGHRIAAVRDGYRERFGAPFWGLHRAQLQRILAASWGNAGLHLGRELTGISEDGDAVALRFADGSTVRAGVVVGADGVHSRVRRWVCDQAPVYSGTSGFRGLAPRAALGGVPDLDAIQFWMGPRAHLLHYPIGDVINFLAVVDEPAHWPWPESKADAAPGELAAHFSGWHPAVIEMITSVPQSPRWGLFALPAMRSWSRGRVVLLGDAAHAMLPHHGQGANQTIEDAAVLATCLAAAGLDRYRAAFARYERLRRARTRKVQRCSWIASAQLHVPDGPAAADRDRGLPGFLDRFGWIHGYDADGR